MKPRIQKSIIALMLCLTLVGTGSISTIYADAAEVNANDQTQSEQETEENQMNADKQEKDSGEEMDNSDGEEQTEMEELPEEGEKTSIASESENAEESLAVGIEYQTHVQSYGWQEVVKDGELAGTQGEAKRVEAIKMKLVNLPEEYEGSSIEYSVHVQSYGWQNPVTDDAVAGTSGQAKRLEAITVKLNGPIAEDYHVYYRTHVQTYGWLGWAKDGARAGSSTTAKRMEAIEIRLVKNGEEAPESTVDAYKCPLVSYQAHMQTYGWKAAVYDDAIGGATGKSKRMESVKINLPDVVGTTGYTGGIAYQAYVQGTGWQEWKSDGQLAGTAGQRKRIEALRMKLTGEVAEYYDVYYSLHLAKVGWTGYVCGGDDALAGSTDLSKRIEAVKIQLVKKGNAIPSTVGTTYIQGYKNTDLYYTGRVQEQGTTANVMQGGTVGTTGQSKRLEGVTLYLKSDSGTSALPTGTIQYATHLSKIGWSDWSEAGEFSGSEDGMYGMEAVRIRLTDDLAKYYDIYYRAHVQKYGWLGWAKNGQTAGTSKIGYRMEAMQVRLVSKDASAPGANSGYYTETRKASGPDAAMYARANMYNSPTPYIIMVDGSTHRVGIYQGSRGFWTCVKYWACGDGKPSTPTVRGVFSVGNRGYYFNSGAYRCFWWTQFYNDYLFHSVLCWPNGAIADGRVGMGLSHGCVRLEMENCKWIYDNIPRGTTVVVYN